MQEVKWASPKMLFYFNFKILSGKVKIRIWKRLVYMKEVHASFKMEYFGSGIVRISRGETSFHLTDY